MILMMALAQATPPVEPLAFADAALEARYQALLPQLRCPKCPNQSLADSDAPIAADLRALVRRMLADGRSDAQIRAHLVARYGDSVLYSPPLRGGGALVWALPGLMTLAIFLMAAWLIRRAGRGLR